MIQAEAYWWESITGPQELIETVANEIRSRKTVALMVPEDLPWRDSMRAAVQNEIRKSPELNNVDVQFIDVKDECSGVKNIGEYLLQRYATDVVASNYRGRESLQSYISKNGVLNNRLLWVKGMTKEDEKNWIDFCRTYTISADIEGHIVLEIRFAGKEDEPNISYIQYASYISDYDVLLFNSVYLDKHDRTISRVWQQYIATLCANLCGTDAEISLELMESTDFRAQEPLQRVREIAGMEYYLRRGENSRNHVLNAARQGRTQEIESRIWKAQLQTIFPLLEMERASFIEKYYAQIKDALRARYMDYNYDKLRRIHQFGSTLEDPWDAEIGTIWRMTKLRRENEHYLLFIPDDSSRGRVELLHELRNNLAHSTVCPVASLVEFIQSFPYKWL